MERPVRMWLSFAVILVLVAGAGLWGFLRWRHNEVFVATDDAYVKGHVVTVASRVPGSILALEVAENEAVKAGQVIARLDPKDLEALEAKSRGSLAEARASMALNRAQIDQAQAQVRIEFADGQVNEAAWNPSGWLPLTKCVFGSLVE